MLVIPSHQLLRSIVKTAGSPAPKAVVIGNFDGVHLGHQALFARARQLGGAGPLVAFSFWPHPSRVLAAAGGRGSPPALILGRQRRRERLAECGVDILIEQPFDQAFASQSPTAFVEEVLIGSLGARWVVVGHDFSFGQGRAGTLELLRDQLGRHGAEVAVVPAVAVSDPDSGEPIVCSSTFVRREVQAGRPERAALVLGQAVELEGRVIHGAARGRTLGFPTANLHCAADLAPAVGIYAAWAELLVEDAAADDAAVMDSAEPLVVTARPLLARHPAAVSVGYNATFVSGDPTLSPISIEAHLIQPQAAPPLLPFYGSMLRLLLHSRLRDEQRFPSVAALIEQMGRDVAESRRRLGLSW